MTKKQRILAWSLAGLAVFLIWQAILLKKYIAVETRPPAWDQAIHLETALDYRHAIEDGRWRDLLFLPPKPGMPPFPPLYHLTLAWIYSFSNPAGMALWMNWCYLVLLCIALFGIGYDYISSEMALAGVILFACAPAVQWLYHNQLIDLALIAWAACAYWMLLKSDCFARRRPSLGFGIFYAAGMLAKWSFFSYMIPAYAMAWIALRDERSRRNVFGSMAVALAGFLPWYWIHFSELPMRLLESSLDLSAPHWRWTAFFDYFLNMVSDFGPLFWILGWLGIVFRQFRQKQKYEWVLPAWVLSSYVFWAVVPNRQMRFLLPGLPGMAVLACAASPRPLLWMAVVFQLATAANYSLAWVSPKTLHLLERPFTILPTDPPAAENWKIPDILQAAQRRHENEAYLAGWPISNLTLVANAPFFNGPDFTWTSKYLGLPNIRIRGVNQRICEFSQFVVLKTGSLGPGGVIQGLPEASQIILRKGGWFDRAYESVQTWPLPDGSSAVLYQQRRLAQAPFKEARAFFSHYVQGPMSARNLRIELGPWDAKSSAYHHVKVSADEAELRQLKVSGLRLEMTDVLFVPAGEHPADKPWEEIRFLKMGGLKINSLTLTADAFKEFLEKRARGLEVRHLEMNGILGLAARFKGLPLSAEASLDVASEPVPQLHVRIRRVRIGPIPIPLMLLQRLQTFTVPLEPNPETPFVIDLPPPSLIDGKLSI